MTHSTGTNQPVKQHTHIFTTVRQPPSRRNTFTIKQLLNRPFKRSMSAQYESTARVGRKNQLFNTKGARLVAGCVVLNSTYDQVLLISSSAKKNKWVLPKGGIEKDEKDDYKLTAIRETWEEAGVSGEILGCLPVVEDLRPPKEWGKMTDDKIMTNPPRSEFYFFEMLADKLHDVYPESDERTRKWFDFEAAIKELNGNKRPELVKILESSRIKR